MSRGRTGKGVGVGGAQQEIKEGKKSEEERVREKNRSRGGRVCWDVFKELFNLNRSAFH